MRYPLFGMMAVLAAGPVFTGPALAQDAAPGTVVRAGDDTMTCRQMADEAAELSAGMGTDRPGVFGVVGEVARSGAAMLVPGAGLAMAGADALTSSGREKREAKAAAGRDRWNYLNGLYAGRGCNAPEQAAVEPAAPAVVPSGPPAVTPAPVAASVPAAPPAPRIVIGTTPSR